MSGAPGSRNEGCRTWPRDPRRYTDDDGLGDACDDDDDGDGYSDELELSRGSDPLDPNSVPRRGLPQAVLQLLLEDDAPAVPETTP